jgi:hypothetical protein
MLRVGASNGLEQDLDRADLACHQSEESIFEVAERELNGFCGAGAEQRRPDVHEIC